MWEDLKLMIENMQSSEICSRSFSYTQSDQWSHSLLAIRKNAG